MDMTPDGLVTLVGVVLSLVFGYIPWVKAWYDQMDSRYKPLFMAAALLLVAFGKLAVDCHLDAACLAANWERVLWVWLTALVANQTTFVVAVRQSRQAAAE